MKSRLQLPFAPRWTGATLAMVLGTAPVTAHAAPEPAEPEPQIERTEAELAVEAANAAANAGDYEAALEHYGRARDLDASLDLDEALAMSHFQIGTDAYSKGEYETALRRFQDAQGLYSSPNFHYNIGQCYEALERPQQAIDSYQAYLRAVPDTPDRANIESKIGRLEKRIADEQAAAQTQPDAPGAVEPEPEKRAPGRAMIASGTVLTGLGAAVAIGGGLTFGLKALERSDRVNEVFEDGNPDGLTLAETERLDAEGRRAQTAQIITMAAGGAVGAVGITLLALGIVEKRRAGNLEAAVPMFDRGFAGLSLAGRF